MTQKKADSTPTYKGKPLVRSGNTLYYGNPAEKYIAMLQVITTEAFQDTEISQRVTVQIISTDESIHTSKRVIKRTEKIGLYSALSIASIWLTRSLASGD